MRNRTVKTGAIILLMIIIAGIIAYLFWKPAKTISHYVDLSSTELNDGPYLFYNNDQIELEWIGAGHLNNKIIAPHDEVKISPQPLFNFKPEDIMDLCIPQPAIQEDIKHIAVLSDIHGQYELFLRLLKANKIIDNDLNWSFGKGHLVIIGDAFDRGDKVTETLWHIIQLSHQALAQGGQVHYLIGNHDVMIMNGDLRYLNEKYNTVESITQKSYDQLFSANSFIGIWLRSRPVAIRLNHILFNHAGFSKELADTQLSIDEINTLFSNKIIDHDKESLRQDSLLNLLSRSKGPIWYRGYFSDTTLVKDDIDEILNHYEADKIIVGHTSFDQVETYFEAKVIAVDTSIKKGEQGEILIIEKDHGYAANLEGNRRKLW